MAVRTFDDVVEIDKPDQDSQYRLRPCDCGSDQVIYAKYIGAQGAMLWRVVCMACGATADLQGNVKHAVQMAWNRRKAPSWERD